MGEETLKALPLKTVERDMDADLGRERLPRPVGYISIVVSNLWTTWYFRIGDRTKERLSLLSTLSVWPQNQEAWTVVRSCFLERPRGIYCVIQKALFTWGWSQLPSLKLLTFKVTLSHLYFNQRVKTLWFCLLWGQRKKMRAFGVILKSKWYGFSSSFAMSSHSSSWKLCGLHPQGQG